MQKIKPIWYEYVMKLLTPKFIQRCSKYTKDFNADIWYITTKRRCEGDRICMPIMMIQGCLLKKDIGCDYILVIESFFDQAWRGFNRQLHSYAIVLDDRGGALFDREEYAKFYYEDFEPDQPLSQEIQALICILYSAFYMLDKGDSIKTDLSKVNAMYLSREIQEVINVHFWDLFGDESK